MKKIIILIVILISNTIIAQNIDKFYDQDGVTSVMVTKKMFQLMGNVKMDAKDIQTQKYFALIKKLDNLKVFTSKDLKTVLDMKLTSEKYAKTAGLQELMRINDVNKNIKIMVKSGATTTQIKELLMFIEANGRQEDSILMSLTGDFTLDEISVLTDKMDIPGGDALKKASQK